MLAGAVTSAVPVFFSALAAIVSNTVAPTCRRGNELPVGLRILTMQPVISTIYMYSRTIIVL